MGTNPFLRVWKFGLHECWRTCSAAANENNLSTRPVIDGLLERL